MTAWDRCATQAQGTHWAVDALWLAAENLEWTNRPMVAATRVQQFLSAYTQGARLTAAQEKLELLGTEARRGAAWLQEPVAALQREIQERSKVRKPHGVFQSADAWLSQTNNQAARVAVGRWAIQQEEWPLPARIAAHCGLMDALLNPTGVTEPSKAEWRRLLDGPPTVRVYQEVSLGRSDPS